MFKGNTKHLVTIIMIFMLLMVGAVQAKDITKIEISYDVNKAALSPIYTHGEWTEYFRNSLETGEGVTLMSLSNSCLQISYNSGESWTNSTQTEEQSKFISTTPMYKLLVCVREDFSNNYFFDTEDDNYKNAEVWLNGVKRDDAEIWEINDYWKCVDVVIPIEVDTASRTLSIDISQAGEYVTKGTTKEYTKQVRYYGEGYDAVTFEVIGASSDDTEFNGNILYVAEDETAEQLTIKATSNTDNNIVSNELTVNVIDEPISVESVTVTPNARNMKKRTSKQFTAEVTGTAVKTVTWSITGSTSESTIISDTGILTIGEDETAETITIRATSTFDNSKYAEAVVTVEESVIISKIELTYDTTQAKVSPLYTYKEFSNSYYNTKGVTTEGLSLNGVSMYYELEYYEDEAWHDGRDLEEKIDRKKEHRITANVYADDKEGYFFDSENLDAIEVWLNGVKIENAIVCDYNEYWKLVKVIIPVDVEINLISRIDLEYDTNKAIVSPAYSYREFSDAYYKTKKVTTEGLSLNGVSMYYELNYIEDSDWHGGYQDDTMIKAGYEHVITANVYAKDEEAYYFDSENLDAIEVYLNGNKIENAEVGGYNEYWELVDVIIPVEVDTTPMVRTITISQEGEYVTKGTTKTFDKVVKFYGDGYDAVTFEVIGANGENTKFDGNILSVDEEETAEKLTIRAISNVDNNVISNELIVNVIDEPVAIESVVVAPNTANVRKKTSKKFGAEVTGTAVKDITWSIIGATSEATTISGTGLLTIGADETAETIVVKATSVFDSSKFGIAGVTIEEPVIINKIELTYDTTMAKVSPLFTYKEFSDLYYETKDVTTEGLSLSGIDMYYELEYYENETWHDGRNIEEAINPLYNHRISADVYADDEDGYFFDPENLDAIEVWLNGVKREDAVVCNYNEYWELVKVLIPVDVEDAYVVTVNGGESNKEYAFSGDIVTITADEPEEGKEFDRWVVVSGDVILEDEESAETTFAMGTLDVEVKAMYKTATHWVGVFTMTRDETQGKIKLDDREFGYSQGQNYNYDSNVTITAQPNPGYTFVKWNIKHTSEGDFVATNINNPATYTIRNDYYFYAEFEKIPSESYTVTFETNGGSAVTPQTVEAGGKVTRPDNPTKENRTFDAWYKDEALTELFSFENETITKDTIIYASWDVTVFVHTYNETTDEINTDIPGTFNMAGFGVDGYNNAFWCTEGKEYTIKATPKAGYRFVEWRSGTKDGEPVSTNAEYTFTAPIIKLYAVFEKDTYTVTFESNGGSAVTPQTIDAGGKAIRPDDPTKENRTFGFWYKDEALTEQFSFEYETITKDITLYARWKVQVFVHTYNETTDEINTDIPGTFNMVGFGVDGYNNAFWCTEGKEHTIKATPKAGYRFVEWRSGTKDGQVVSTNAEYTFTAPIIKLYAVFERAIYSINCVAYNISGSGTAGTVYLYTDKDSYEGSGAFGTATASTNVTINAVANPGYKFVEWRKAVPSSPEARFATTANYTFEATEDLEGAWLYAIFQEIPAPCSVTVISGDADVTEASSGDVVTITANTPEAGKEFDKWVVVSGDITLVDEEAEETTFVMGTANVKVTATYKDATKAGDINGDTLINSTDLQRLYTHLNGSNIITDAKLLVIADVNKDGHVNSTDLQRLYTHLNGTNPLEND